QRQETEVRIRALGCTAEAVPWLDYVLDDPEPAAILAGGHCIPIKVPRAARFVWHALFLNAYRGGHQNAAFSGLRDATMLAAAVFQDDPESLAQAWQDAPRAMRGALRRSLSLPLPDALLTCAPRLAESL